MVEDAVICLSLTEKEVLTFELLEIEYNEKQKLPKKIIPHGEPETVVFAGVDVVYPDIVWATETETNNNYGTGKFCRGWNGDY